MRRREFIAAGGGGGVALLVGARALFGDGVRAGPGYGPVTAPPGSETAVLDNGRRASLYEEGRLAFLGASLVSQHSAIPAIVGRLKNVSTTGIEQLRVKVQFLDETDAVLVQGWITRDDLAAGEAWQFTVSYPGENTNRIAGANIAAFDIA